MESCQEADSCRRKWQRASMRCRCAKAEGSSQPRMGSRTWEHGDVMTESLKAPGGSSGVSASPACCATCYSLPDTPGIFKVFSFRKYNSFRGFNHLFFQSEFSSFFSPPRWHSVSTDTEDNFLVFSLMNNLLWTSKKNPYCTILPQINW